ncbi:hypothetical protein RJ640_014864, partial [Escallonia rubra]
MDYAYPHAMAKVIDFKKEWDYIQKIITKLKESLPEPKFNAEEYMLTYSYPSDAGSGCLLVLEGHGAIVICAYKLCTQMRRNDHSKELYDKYRETIEEHVNSMVLPSVKGKDGELMLRELVKGWSNHKVMVKWLSRFFTYLNRYYAERGALPKLNEVGLACFRDQVHPEFGKVRDAVIGLIGQERNGEQIDQALLKNVVDIFVEVGMGKMNYYEKNFETMMLQDSAAYYSGKASIWISEYPYPDYILKVEECLKQEMDRVSHYLHSSTEPKLLE